MGTAHRTEASRPAVWRWQARYAEEGVEGLLRDKTRQSGRARLTTVTVAKVLALTCADPPAETTHWTGRAMAMAKAMGVSLSAIQRIWAAHHPQPHRLRSFKRSTDLAFAAKVEDVVGLFIVPAGSRPGALHRREISKPNARPPQPGLPLKPGECGTMTHDYNAVECFFSVLTRRRLSELIVRMDSLALGRR